MPTTMLDYTKEILEKVSFDPELFDKEYKKALRILGEDEIRELMMWCKMHLGYEMPVA